MPADADNQLLVFAQAAALVSASTSPQYTNTVVSIPPSLSSSPFRYAEVDVTFVAPSALVMNGTRTAVTSASRPLLTLSQMK